jgi:pyrimidine-nucleoside phosphorylase
LGGGREKKEDTIDPGVGLEFHKRIGDRVATNESLVTIHYHSDAKLADAIALIENSFVFSDQPAPPKKLVRRLVGA